MKILGVKGVSVWNLITCLCLQAVVILSMNTFCFLLIEIFFNPNHVIYLSDPFKHACVLVHTCETFKSEAELNVIFPCEILRHYAQKELYTAIAYPSQPLNYLPSIIQVGSWSAKVTFLTTQVVAFLTWTFPVPAVACFCDFAAASG